MVKSLTVRDALNMALDEELARDEKVGVVVMTDSLLIGPGIYNGGGGGPVRWGLQGDQGALEEIWGQESYR